MTFEQLQESLSELNPPQAPAPLVALWKDARGDWDGAHVALQDDSSTDSAWVHAYLHRKEGDLSNAAYWYQRAGKTVAEGSLDDEWEAIARALTD